MRKSRLKPKFGKANNYKDIQIGIANRIITYPSYIYVLNTGEYVFIDEDLSINKVVGNNPKDVIRLKQLPNKNDAKEDEIYLVNGTMSIFYNDKFFTMKDYTEKIRDLKNRVITIENEIEELKEKEKESVIEKDTIYEFPTIGESNKIYIDTSENASYRWDSNNNKYYCIGRDYTTINLINGNV